MNGSCHCGKIKIEVTGKWTWAGRCHCRDCQKISGAAYLAFACFKSSQVKFLAEIPKTYKSSESVTRTFCDQCGSPVEWKQDSEPQMTNLTLGLFE